MNELVQIEVSFEYAPKVYCYKRENGWYWKFKFPNNTWFYGPAPGNTKKVARQNANLKERQLAKGLFTQREAEKYRTTSSQVLTFDDAIEQFIDHLKSEDASPNYYKGLEATLKAAARYFIEVQRIDFAHKLTEDHAYRYRQSLLARVKSEEIKRVTAFKLLNNFKRLYKWLRRRKKIASNPWVEVEAIVVPKEERSRRVTPTPDIIPKLMSADYKHRFNFPIKEFVYGLFRTGARKQELLYMEVDDVDWETGRWEIRKKKCPVKHGDVWFPKYKKSRVTFLPQDVLDLFKPLVERAKLHKVVGYTPNFSGVMKPQEARFIFTMIDVNLSSPGRRKVYRRVDSVRGSWGGLFIAAGLVESKLTFSRSTAKYKNGHKVRTDVAVPFTRHDMRRGFNVAAKKAGMSLDDRAMLLGHGRDVNESSYCGEPELDGREVLEIINNKMWKGAV